MSSSDFFESENCLISMSLNSAEKTESTPGENTTPLANKRQITKKCVSKRRLNFGQDNQKKSLNKRRYHNGMSKLDIISLLVPYQNVLYQILDLLHPRDVKSMRMVSRRWRYVANEYKQSNETLQKLHYEDVFQKENETPKSNERAPVKRRSLTPFNSYNKTNIDLNTTGGDGYDDDSFTENQKIVETLQRNERLVKCPRCNRPSRIEHLNKPYDNYDNFHEASWTNSLIIPPATTSAIKPQSIYENSFCHTATSPSSALATSNHESTCHDTAYICLAYGQCTGSTCKYKFCLNCFCSPHPGKKCLITELGTPSKLHHRDPSVQKPSRAKVNRKSLKRLCF